jgi:hypothetical protein
MRLSAPSGSPRTSFAICGKPEGRMIRQNERARVYGCLLLSATSGAGGNSRRPQLLRDAICDFQFAAAREATVRKARMRSASAPVLIVGALVSPLALLMSSVWVRLPCPITRAA